MVLLFVQRRSNARVDETRHWTGGQRSLRVGAHHTAAAKILKVDSLTLSLFACDAL